MKKVITLITIIFLTCLLATGCTTSQKQNTGMVAGGVVGGLAGNAITGGSTAGTIVGAVGGAYVGRAVAH